MGDTEYLSTRAEQELCAAIAASDARVREIHLQLADAYSFRLREVRAMQRRSEMELSAP
jgi:hypothetical protein